jgi:hypothetical protein
MTQRTTTTTASAADRVAAFRTAAAVATRTGDGLPDLYDLQAVLVHSDHFRASLEALAAAPLAAGWRTVESHATNDRSLYGRKLAGAVREQVQRTHSVALAERDGIRAAGEAPILSGPYKAKRAAQVQQYESRVLAMSDEGLVRHAAERATGIVPRDFDEIRALAVELARRNLTDAAQGLQDAVHGRRTAYQSATAYLAACDRLARAEAWLAQAGDDPELIVVVKGTAHHVRVSELLNAEAV